MLIFVHSKIKSPLNSNGQMSKMSTVTPSVWVPCGKRGTNPTVAILFYTCFTFRCNTRQSLWADSVAGKAPWPWWYGSLNKFQLNSSPQISFHFRFFICFTQIATANGHKAVEKELRKQLKVRKPQDTESGTTLSS